jgi:hypothetical protein
MPWPVYQTPARGNTGANVTTWTFTYPSGIQAGDLLLLFVGADGNPTFSGLPSGWLELIDIAGNGNACHGMMARKFADGTETGNFTATSSASEGGGWQVCRISGAHPTENPALSVGVNAATANPNPDSLNPPNWDIEQTLWIAWCFNDGNVAVTAGPANYTNFANDRWANTAGAGSSIATRKNGVASEDPGTFTMAAEDSRAYTIAIRPASSPKGLPVRHFDGTDDDLMQLPGNAVGMTHGTFAAIWKMENLTGLHAIGSWATSGGTFRCMLTQTTGDDIRQWTSSESLFVVNALTTQWFFHVMRKATGSATPRFSVYNYMTDTWSHGNGSSAQANWTAIAATDRIRRSVGSAEFMFGKIAACAVWSNTLPWTADATGDTNIQNSGMHLKLSNWLNTAVPSELWAFNQSNVAHPCDGLIGGGGTQVAITGTTVESADGPFDFQFDFPNPLARQKRITQPRERGTRRALYPV